MSKKFWYVYSCPSNFLKLLLLITPLLRKSRSFLDLRSNKTFIVSIVSSAIPVNQWLGVIIEKELFWSVILKTELPGSEEVTAYIHLTSSTRTNGGSNEKIFICVFNLNSKVCWSWIFVCWTSVSLCFLLKSNNSLFNNNFWIILLLCF